MTLSVRDQVDMRERLHEALYEALLDKIRRDRFPSVSMMNLVEAGISERQFADYVEILLDKISDEQFPSPDLVKRLTRLV